MLYGLLLATKSARVLIRSIMVDGGIASYTDPVVLAQFSAEETRTAVEEAENAERYVMAHAYTDRCIRHEVSNGVRPVEDGKLPRRRNRKACGRATTRACRHRAPANARRIMSPRSAGAGSSGFKQMPRLSSGSVHARADRRQGCNFPRRFFPASILGILREKAIGSGIGALLPH